MRKTWVVTAETYLRQIKSWSFLFMILGPFLMFGLTMAISYFSAGSAASSQEIAVIATQPTSLRTTYLAQKPANINRQIQTVTAAKRALNQNHLAGYLRFQITNHQITAEYHGSKGLTPGTKAQIQNYLAQTQQTLNYRQARLTPSQQRAMQQAPQLTQHVAKATGNVNLAKTISFWLIVTLIYIILITYTSITTQEIAMDKGTKIMEIIFSSTTATSYFVGKIGGILLIIITQIAIYLLGGGALYHWAVTSSHWHQQLAQYHDLVVAVIHNLLNANLLYLFCGVVLFTLLAAYSGAIVAKAEDASKAAQPVIMLGLVGFFATFPFQNNLNAFPVKVLSYVPFLSSYFMPMRIINGSVGTGALLTSLVILLATIILMALSIGRHYQDLMLQTDHRGFFAHLLGHRS